MLAPADVGALRTHTQVIGLRMRPPEPYSPEFTWCARSIVARRQGPFQTPGHATTTEYKRPRPSAASVPPNDGIGAGRNGDVTRIPGVSDTSTGGRDSPRDVWHLWACLRQVVGDGWCSRRL